MKDEKQEDTMTGFTENHKKELDSILSEYESVSQQASSQQAIKKGALGKHPTQMQSASNIFDIVEKMDTLKAGLESYIVDTRGEESAYQLVKRKRTVDKTVEMKVPRTASNLFGIMWGWPEMAYGKKEQKTMPVKEEYTEKIPLEIGELRKTLEKFIRAYIDQLDKYADELDSMCENIDGSIAKLASNREEYTDGAQQAIKLGGELVEKRTELQEKKDTLQRMIESTSPGEESYATMKKYNAKLKKAMAKLEIKVEDHDSNEEWYSNSEEIMEGYEDSLINIQGFGTSFANRIRRHTAFIDNLLEVSSNTNEVIETMAKSIRYIEEGMGDVFKLTEYSGEIYGIALSTASHLRKKDSYVVEAKSIVDTAQAFSTDRLAKFSDSCASLEEKARPRTLGAAPESQVTYSSPGNIPSGVPEIEKEVDQYLEAKDRYDPESGNGAPAPSSAESA